MLLNVIATMGRRQKEMICQCGTISLLVDAVLLSKSIDVLKEARNLFVELVSFPCARAANSLGVSTVESYWILGPASFCRGLVIPDIRGRSMAGSSAFCPESMRTCLRKSLRHKRQRRSFERREVHHESLKFALFLPLLQCSTARMLRYSTKLRNCCTS